MGFHGCIYIGQIWNLYNPVLSHDNWWVGTSEYHGKKQEIWEALWDTRTPSRVGILFFQTAPKQQSKKYTG